MKLYVWDNLLKSLLLTASFLHQTVLNYQKKKKNIGKLVELVFYICRGEQVLFHVIHSTEPSCCSLGGQFYPPNLS